MSFCTSCGASLFPGAIFCGSCGTTLSAAPAAPAAAPAPSPYAAAPVGAATLPICLGCGIVAPSAKSACTQCGHAFGPTPAIVPRTTGDLVWAGVRASIRCRACGGEAPIDGCDLQGPYPCIHCGIDQFMNREQWLEGLRDAHEVTDMCGPGEGAFPSAVSVADYKYAPIGREYVKAIISTSYSLGEGTPLKLEVSPGNPLCEACHVPMQLVSVADPLVVRCPQCQKSHAHPRPQGAPGEVVGIVGHHHEQGVQDVAAERDAGGAVAIRCPGCSAPLPIAAVGATITCAYCGVTSRLGPAMRRSMGSKDATPPRWWALFRGPSPARGRLEHAATERRAQSAAVPVSTFDRAELRAQQREIDRKQQSKANLLVTGIIIVVAVVIGVVTAGATMFRSSPTRSTTSTTRTKTTSKSKSTAPPGPSFTVTWKGKVTSATGKALRRGTACAAEASAEGEKVKRFRVECGTTSLYDSAIALNGMSNYGSALIEAPSGSGGHRYMLLYHDVGQRTGRSEVQFNSASESTVSSRGSPSFEVKMTFDDLSSERTGPAVFATSLDTSHAVFTAKAKSVVGKGPVAQGQSCKLDFYGRGVKSDGRVCTVKLDCAGKNVYYTTSYCTADARGRPQTFTDKTASSHFSLDVSGKSAEMGADSIASPFSAQFELH
jgi:hypothetical protein